MANKIIATNRKAYHNYHIIQKYESGISLLGSEVKSIRENKVNIKEGYIRIRKKEVFIIGMNIAEYSHSGYSSHNPDREKKLLLNKKEIDKIKVLTDEKGKTLIPLRLYFKNGKIKIEFAVAKGRKLWDKRNYKKNQDIKKEIERSLKRR